MKDWFTFTPSDLAAVLISAAVTYAAILLYTRVVGLRSFSKMSAADFAMTVAVGSLFASTVSSPSPSLGVGLFAIACLFAGQWSLAVLRQKFGGASDWIDNRATLLMAHGEFIDEHLAMTNVTREDVYGKLREANALDLSSVVGVVLESTGDVSVLHPGNGQTVSPEIVAGVRGAERLRL